MKMTAHGAADGETGSGGNQGNGSGDRVSKVPGAGLSDARNLLGFLVAGFAGVLNVIGLKSAEIGVVLRNEPLWIPVVAILLLGGVLAAVLSVFVTNRYPISPIAAVIAFLLTLATFSATVALIPSPFTGHEGEQKASVVITFVLLGLSAGFAVVAWARRNHKKAKQPVPDLLNLQCLLLGVAVMLTSSAAYGALRLETISQTASLAEIGDTVLANGPADTLVISVSASKLSTSEWVALNVIAAPRSWNIKSHCHAPKVRTLIANQNIGGCAEDPCYYFIELVKEHCVQLSADVIAPDSSGGVQRTIEVPFSAATYQHIQITASTCRPIMNSKHVGTCGPVGGTSRLDIAIPGPPGTGQAAGRVTTRGT